MNEKTRRTLSCASLLALLGVCAWTGARPPETAAVSVPVVVGTIPSESLALETMQETRERLDLERERALSLWESVLTDPSSSEQDRRKANEQKMALAERMEKEAALVAQLAFMGVGDAAAVLSGGGVSVIVPWQAGENEQSRVRIIDAAATQTGLDSAQVKIILAKK